MQKPPFRFKHFSVAQDRCAMKVNTDGVLLGAWGDMSEAKRILDIGTGTGVIALMMAQRNGTALIDAIDIDSEACLHAEVNFANSPWSKRLMSIHTSLQDYLPDHKYDLIISNPPYFIDDYKTDNHQKNLAKHSISLSYSDLIKGITRLLRGEGTAHIVLPIFNLDVFQSLAVSEGLYITALTEVTAVAGKEPYLALIKLQRTMADCSRGAITIQNAEGIFTNEYKYITREFYLKF